MEHGTERTDREEPRAWNDNRERKPVAPAKAIIVTKAARFREKLREARPSKKIVFGLMVAAVALTLIVGFNWGGWLTGGAAQHRVDAGARDAVVLRLVPICVAQFNLDPQKAPKLAELKAIASSWSRPDYVKKQGWATMPGEKEPDSNVADACTKLLMGA
jgi:hypothetical protein